MRNFIAWTFRIRYIALLYIQQREFVGNATAFPSTSLNNQLWYCKYIPKLPAYMCVVINSEIRRIIAFWKYSWILWIRTNQYQRKYFVISANSYMIYTHVILKFHLSLYIENPIYPVSRAQSVSNPSINDQSPKTFPALSADIRLRYLSLLHG